MRDKIVTVSVFDPNNQTTEKYVGTLELIDVKRHMNRVTNQHGHVVHEPNGGYGFQIEISSTSYTKG